MAENAARRAIRLLDLVPYLSANPGTSVKELARIFHVSPSELIKDLDLLFVCGLPGYTPLELIDLSVEDGIVTIRDPQNLATPRKFSEEEALTLRIALAALEDLLPPERREVVRTLRGKIASLFNSAIPEAALFYEGDVLKERLDLINSAITKGNRVRFRYKNLLRGESSTRELSIGKIIVEKSRTLVEGWDHSVQGKRTFLLVQMEEIEVLNAKSELSEVANAAVIEAELVDSNESEFIQDNRALLTPAGENSYKMELFQPEWLVRGILADAGKVTVIRPSHIRERVRQVAQSALRNY